MRGLNKLYYIKKDIKSLQEEIKNIPEISAMQMTGMPHSNSVSDPIYNLILKKEKLVEKLNKKIERYLDELIRIEDIIDHIEDIEIRTMARMRFVLNKRWEDIGKEFNYDRTSCSKKVRNYFEIKPQEDNIKCKDCEYLMFSDCYGECSKAYKGIVNPNDSCGKGKKRQIKKDGKAEHSHNSHS